LCTRQTHEDETKQALIIHKASSNTAWQQRNSNKTKLK